MQWIYREECMKMQKKLWMIGILAVFITAFSIGQVSHIELYDTGKVRFDQDYILDDNTLPEDHFFETPSTITCDPEGNIYVVDSGAKNIKKFSPKGKFLKAFGREGQGPGEFGGVYYSAFARDRLVVWDSGNRRLCAFTPDGEFVTSTNISYESGSVRKLRGLPAGEVLVEMEKTFRSEPDKPQECRIDLYSEDLKFIRNIYTRNLWRKKYIRTEEYGTSVLFFPYSADVQWDVTPDGRIVIGYSANYEMEVYDRIGNKTAAISHDYEPVRITDKDKKAFFDSVAFYTMGERLKEVPEYITKYTEFPKQRPAFANILSDAHGNIWVVLNREQEDEKGKMFEVFDSSGQFISRVRIEGSAAFPDSRNAYILHAGSLFVIETGKDDLYRIIRYKMTAPYPVFPCLPVSISVRQSRAQYNTADNRGMPPFVTL
jgi:hypothetical protein